MALACAAAACGSQAETMTLTRAEYAAHKRQIEADYKLEKTACDRLTANDKDVCSARAKGHEKVAKAELDYNNTGDAADRNRLAVAKADADLAVAREQCDERKGRDKGLCVSEADAAHAKTVADARLARQLDATGKDADQDKRDADYRLAVARCDALGGTARTNCIGLARTRFGKP